MPKFKFGDMWKTFGKKNSLFCITTNSYINQKGELVMGRGIALEMKKRFPKFAKEIGDLFYSYNENWSYDMDYGFLTWKVKNQLVGLIQVKNHFKEKAKINLIQDSIDGLDGFLDTCPWIKEVNMNYPGIGYGGLEIKKVKRSIDWLPDKYNIWRFEREKK